MLVLSEKWREKLRRLPETGMDYQVVTVVLHDGRGFPRTIVEGACCISAINGVEGVPFREEDIEDIVVTHDKWDWRKP